MRGLSSDVYYLGERVTRQHGMSRPAMIPFEPPADMMEPIEGTQSWYNGRIGIPWESLVVPGEYEVWGRSTGKYAAWVRTRIRTPQILRSEGLSVLPLPSTRVSYRQGDTRMGLEIPMADRVPEAYRPRRGAQV